LGPDGILNGVGFVVSRSKAPLSFSGVFDGVDDAQVTCAPAQIANQGITDFLIRGIGIAIEQRPAGDQNPWSAETALHPALSDNGRLDRIEDPIVSQTFHCGDLSAITLHCQDHAAVDWIPVNQDRACAAFPGHAAVFCPGESQLIPQHLQQGQIRRDIYLFEFTVNLQHNAMISHRILL